MRNTTATATAAAIRYCLTLFEIARTLFEIARIASSDQWLPLASTDTIHTTTATASRRGDSVRIASDIQCLPRV